MKTSTRSILFVFLLFCCVSVLATDAIVGYYPSWMRDTLPAEQLDLDRITHLMHAFAYPSVNGDIVHSSSFLYPQLINRTHENGRLILISLGGWGHSENFAPVAADSNRRHEFVASVLTFCLENNYDGVDLDWEYPSNAIERKNMTLLVKELRDEFSKLMRPKPLLITMAVTAGDWQGQWLDYDELKKYIDWFGCMTYDFHGSWSDHAGHNSPLYASGGDTDGSVDSGFQYLTKTRGLVSEQILLGVPFYGRGFQASRLYGPSTGDGSEHQYREIPELIEAGWTFYWDDAAKVPYIINPGKTTLISYDDTISVRLKAEYAIDKKVKGVMIWSLGQDVIDGQQVLLQSVAKPILNQTAVGKNSEHTPVDFELVNFPNPFNNTTTISLYLDKSEFISLNLLDIRGRVVKSIFDGRIDGDRHVFHVEADDLSSGVYLCQIASESFNHIRKITLLK